MQLVFVVADGADPAQDCLGLLLEDKASVKKRLKRSPDWGDAFVLTHAEPVVPKARTHSAPQIRAEDYDEAVEMAKGCPGLQFGGNVEVRDINPM